MLIKKGSFIMGALGSAFAIGAAAVGILIFINPAESMAQGLPLNATIQFGNVDVGSGFPARDNHDESGHASDKLIPGAVSIALDGSVNFITVGSSRHRVMIFPPGTLPGDINTDQEVTLGNGTPAQCRMGNYIDPDNAANPDEELLDLPPCAGGDGMGDKTFTEPGKWLVICQFIPHFEAGMWGWVNVIESGPPNGP